MPLQLLHQVGHNSNWNIDSYEQDQCGDEQQEFGEGRRQEFERWLYPFDFRQLEGRQRVGAAKHALQLLPQRQRPVEHM